MSEEKDILVTLDEDFDEVDSDQTIIQGFTDLTAAAERHQAYLIVISGNSAGKMYKVAKVMVIGRAVDAEIVLDDEGISRQHAQVVKDDFGNISIKDLNSTNGTYFNGTRFNKHVLRDGDKIQIGSTTILKFSYQDTLEEAFQKNQYEAATKDGLTGIYNKKYFAEQLYKDFSYSLRHSEIISLIVFDIDHFKNINDTHGHQTGDLVLRQLAKLVEGSLRSEDLLARTGGEEFAIVLRQVDEKRAYVLAERIRRSVEVNKFMKGDTRIRVTISLGVATLRRANFRRPSFLIEAADQQLYRAKRSGRNRVASTIR